MIESVTYTGFEPHPERRAWVERELMPVVRGVLARDPEPLAVYWHDPDVEQFYSWELQEVIRTRVVPGLGDDELVGHIIGNDPDKASVVGSMPGVIFVLRAPGLPAGWTYITRLDPDDELNQALLEWAVRKVYLHMLSAARERMQESYRRDPVTAGGE